MSPKDTLTDDVTVRPELIERLGALAHEMDASAEELQAAAREWAEISAALAEADAEIAAGAPLHDAEEVFAELDAILRERFASSEK